MDARELKEILGSRAKSIIANGMGLIEKRVGTNIFVNCPLHSDKEPSMSWFEDGLMWKCHACNGHIDIFDYLVDHRGMNFTEAMKEVAEMTNTNIEFKSNSPKPTEAILTAKKEFDKPLVSLVDLNAPAIEYMALRGIKEETLTKHNVKLANWGGSLKYAFQFFNQNKELEFVTFRKIGKPTSPHDKGGCLANTKAILWNMDNIDTSKPLVITEGVPDALIISQSGYENVSSVPMGANNMTWIDNCWDFLQEVTEIILWHDNDSPGLKMATEIKQRLGNVKLITSSYGKDPNEVHYRKGPEYILELIELAIKETPNGIMEMSSIQYKSAMEMQDGIETGLIEVDRHLKDLKLGEATVMFGRNNEGKTTVVSQILGHSIHKRVPVFMYSGEMSPQKMQNWIYRQLIGTDTKHLQTIEGKYGNVIEPRPASVKAIKEWHRDLFYLYDNAAEYEGDKLDFMFDTMRLAARRYGVKLFILDNLMSLLETTDANINSDQTRLMQKINTFKVVENCHIILLAHPNKMAGKELTEGSEGNLTKYCISGSANISNNIDNIIAIERFFQEDREADAVISVLKDRETGQRGSFLFYFSLDTLRFYSKDTPANTNYGWEQGLKMEDVVEGFALVKDKDCPF